MCEHGEGGPDLQTAVVDLVGRMFPTPRATDGTKGGPNQRGSSGDLMLPSAVAQLVPAMRASDTGTPKGRSSFDFGPYARAVTRWENVVGRQAPDPTLPSPRDGKHRLSPLFVEWMIGLPAGWVTDVPGLPRSAQLKALGNGVVPLQGSTAFRLMVARSEALRRAAGRLDRNTQPEP